MEDQNPDFATRAPEPLRRSLKIDALIDDLSDGLRRAGFSIEGRWIRVS